MRGIGSMLYELGGGTKESASKYYGKKIKWARHEGDIFKIKFYEGPTIQITDEGQSCCEHRYMTCDDDLKILKDTVLNKIEVKYADADDNNGDSHEIAFLDVQTNKGSIQFATHNKHNGYYGGFGLSIQEVGDGQSKDD